MIYKNSFLIDSKLIWCFLMWRNRLMMYLLIIVWLKGLVNFFLVLDKSFFNFKGLNLKVLKYFEIGSDVISKKKI